MNYDVKGEVRADEILVCVGRTPNVDELGLEQAGITFDRDKGVEVDDFLCSSNAHVYAAGDACLALKFTNVAEASARIAVRNALTEAGQRYADIATPWYTFCNPEIAHIGLQVWEARRQGMNPAVPATFRYLADPTLSRKLPETVMFRDLPGQRTTDARKTRRCPYRSLDLPLTGSIRTKPSE